MPHFDDESLYYDCPKCGNYYIGTHHKCLVLDTRNSDESNIETKTVSSFFI